jgi:hypothetical protein
MSQLRETIAALFYSGQLVELRVLGHKATYNLWFNEPDQLAEAAEEFSNDPSIKGTYVTLHTLDKQKICTKQRGVILNSLANMAKPAAQATTNDDVKALNWFLIDCDPERTNGQSKSNSTRGEKKAAADRANVVHEYLTSLGWPEPVLADSGNGWHMLYRVDIPLWKEHDGKLVGTGDALILRSCLVALSSMFTTPEAKIDISVWKPAQVTKLYGTMARKGANEDDRPWRRSKLVDVPRQIETVPLEKLKELAALAPPEARKRQGEMPVLDDDFDIEDFCTFYGLEVVGEPYEKADGKTYHILAECPLAGHKHSGDQNKTALIVGDTLGFHCWSDDCDGKTIGDLLRKLNETHNRYDGPLFVEQEIDWNAWGAAVDVAEMPEEEKPAETFEETDSLKFEGKIVVGATQTQEAQPIQQKNYAKITLKYPELAFPYESLPPGRLKDLVDKACEGGLDPGLACPAIMALASSLPFKDRMDGAKINLYVCLLALVGAGKDTAIKRALNVLGIEGNQLVYTSYAPSGERSIAMLLGDKQTGTKNAPVTTPGPLRHCIVTTELEDTLAKSRGETSSVLQAMQHYWDHNNKTYSDSKKGTQKVNCRLSWLTALPVGDDEISTDAFRLAFGEHTSHGIVDRMFFGFSERKFDGRRSRNWEVPFDFNNYTIFDDSPMDNPNVKVTVERTETLLGRLQKQEVTGFADGVEELYLNWNGDGRRTYDVHKVAVLVAILNNHKLVEKEDWLFAVALMDWQARIREVFSTGKAKRVHQGEMNELVIKELEKRTTKVLDGITSANMKMIPQKNGKGEMVERPFVRWKAMANEGRWYKFGMDAERTIEQLQKAAAIQFREIYEGDTTEIDKSWIRLMGQPK